MDNAAKLKSLQSRLSRTRQKILELKNESSSINKQLSRLFKVEEELEKGISELTEEDVQVSEHAILRFLERIKGLDIEAIKQEIVTQEMLPQIQHERSGRFSINKSHVIVVEEGIVTTVIPNEKGGGSSASGR